MTLFVFGIGYSASHYLRRPRAFARVAGTVRTPEKMDELTRMGVEPLRFDGETADPRLLPALAEADAILVSAQPSQGADPVLRLFRDEVAASRASRIVYLSTIGVYGDHGGAWVDERTRPEPTSKRAALRLEVEGQWLDLGRTTGKQVVVLRLAGIYGPGRSVLDDLLSGTARRIGKPGQVFNRIHVDDIGNAIEAGFARPGLPPVLNVTDDEPAPAPDVVSYGAALLGLDPPPLLPFEQAELSPMARSFYGANRRVSNARMKASLGIELLYPTYREGLSDLMRRMALPRL